MSTQSVRALRADLAAAVRRAAQGERIVVTVGGRPSAQLGPLDDQAPDLDRLVASGAVVAHRGGPTALAPSRAGAGLVRRAHRPRARRAAGLMADAR